jgi:hypothetical protein
MGKALCFDTNIGLGESGLRTSLAHCGVKDL